MYAAPGLVGQSPQLHNRVDKAVLKKETDCNDDACTLAATTADSLTLLETSPATAQLSDSSHSFRDDSEQEKESEPEAEPMRCESVQAPSVDELPLTSFQQPHDGKRHSTKPQLKAAAKPSPAWPVLINPAMLAANALAAAHGPTPNPLSWSNNIYTVMLRNLPNKASQKTLIKELEIDGFGEAYDFLYLPIDADTKVNKGYAFINFVNPGVAMAFRQCYEGRSFAQFNSSKVLSVTPAALQGFAANYARHHRAQLNESDPDARPIFLRDPPSTQKGVGGASRKQQKKPVLGRDRSAAASTAPVHSGAQSCSRATRLDPTTRFCTECGGQADLDFKFCYFCGTLIPSRPKQAGRSAQ